MSSHQRSTPPSSLMNEQEDGVESPWTPVDELDMQLHYMPTARPPPLPTRPTPVPRTIVCEGKLSVLSPAQVSGPNGSNPRFSGSSHNLADLKMRRRSLDVLRTAFANMVNGGKESTSSVPNNKVAKDKWTSVQAWLDDASLLHLEGFIAAQTEPPPSNASNTSLNSGLKWRRLSREFSTVRKSVEGAVTLGGDGERKRPSLEVWNRRSWSIDADGPYAEALQRRPTRRSSTFMGGSSQSKVPVLSTFRVLSVDRERTGTMLLLHLEPYTPASTMNQNPDISPLIPSGEIVVLYLRFKAPAKLDRWRAALSLALCVAQARSEADAAQEMERRFAEAEEARRIAEIEKDKVEKKMKKEKKAWEKKVRDMFSAEEVQDVYQETADQLAEAERKITDLEQQLQDEREKRLESERQIARLRQQHEGPLGEFNALVLRHEELCKKHEEQTRENVLIRALYEKELNAHRRLAGLLRKQAHDNMLTAESLAAVSQLGILSPPLSPSMSRSSTSQALSMSRSNTSQALMSTASLPLSDTPASQSTTTLEVPNPTMRTIPGEIQRRLSAIYN
ncbi:uncharacterized protein EV422DRAFT_512316 [Fimicolochytrium jonesii]|uniref:uncharacterized protein n=1 Tax=Fimicolochytrium jonesii TaxID=1396493 RepID=UPI0022FDF240|nr:uncharacterized protein EV422DRAFT_512316 [Fimicolochytrium jonesii]KAI8827008.1 hypothetical protein EV422DRAFT_512316 [Fimicolochytrium jonesii]